jgi:predicted permease
MRSFRKAKLFTAVAICSLALGMGANTAIFSLLDQVMLQLLPVKQPEQLVALKMEGFHYGNNSGMNAISYPMYKDFRDNNKVFSGMFGRFATPVSLGVGGRTERVSGELVTGSYFPVLGVGPAVGRTFTASDDRLPGGHPIVVLSYGFWQSRFALDPAIVGKQIIVNGRTMTVIGVAQRGFDGVQLEYHTQVFIPMMMKAQITPFWDALRDRRWRWVNAFGRLKPGVGLTQAQAGLQPFMHSMLEMEVREAAFRNASPYTRQQFLKSIIKLLPGSQGNSYIRQALSGPLWMLLAITGAVLLMACTNLANLLLARSTMRQREIAIRLAVGASRSQIIRQLLIESFLLSLFGAAVGLVFGWAANRVLVAAFLPSDGGEYALRISALPNAPVLLFTFGVMLLTTLLCGLIPALKASRPDVTPTLKNEAGSVVGGSHAGLRKSLVILQVTLSLLLLIGAGLFIRTLANLRDLGPGFNPEHLVGFNLDPSLNGYSSDRAKTFYRQLSDELAATPGIKSVGLASMRILEGDEWDSSMTVEGYTPKPGSTPEPYMNSVGPNYFATMGIAMLRGRDFNAQDVASVKSGPDPDDYSPTKAIINESFARKYFAGRDPIGLHIGFGSDPGTKTPIEVIGVVKDVKYTNLRDEIPVQAFVPYLSDRHIAGMTIYVRSSLDTKELAGLVRRKVRQLDTNLPIYGMRSTEEQIDLSLRSERLIASLSAVFGFLATALAVTGLYGVMAYTVSRRTREIGIRMALGAVRTDVMWMVMREVLVLVAAGVAIGIPAAIALTYLIRQMLFGLQPNDPATIAGATVLSVLVASLAGFIPALRASQVEPTSALRYD